MFLWGCEQYLSKMFFFLFIMLEKICCYWMKLTSRMNLDGRDATSYWSFVWCISNKYFLNFIFHWCELFSSEILNFLCCRKHHVHRYNNTICWSWHQGWTLLRSSRMWSGLFLAIDPARYQRYASCIALLWLHELLY